MSKHVRPERDFPYVAPAVMQAEYEHAMTLTLARHSDTACELLAGRMVPPRLVEAVYERPLRVVQPTEWSVRV